MTTQNKAREHERARETASVKAGPESNCPSVLNLSVALDYWVPWHRMRPLCSGACTR